MSKQLKSRKPRISQAVLAYCEENIIEVLNARYWVRFWAMQSVDIVDGGSRASCLGEGDGDDFLPESIAKDLGASKTTVNHIITLLECVHFDKAPDEYDHGFLYVDTSYQDSFALAGTLSDIRLGKCSAAGWMDRFFKYQNHNSFKQLT